MGWVRNLISVFIVLLGIVSYSKWHSGDSPRPAPVVETKLGKIAGVKLKSKGGRDINAYKGIPFAKPPVAELRFRRPAPITEPWEGIYRAVDNPSACIQHLVLGPIKTWTGKEDCLYLNVYVPDVQGDYYRVSLSKLNLLQDFKVKPISIHTSLKGILLAIFFGWVRFHYCYKFNGYKATF